MLIVPLLTVALAQSPPLGRALTQGERAFLTPVFRDAVDYDSIRIVHGRAFPFQGGNTYVTIRDVVYAPGPLYRDDFSQASPQRQAFLVHEVAHVWQNANGIGVLIGALRALLVNGGRYGRAYRYDLVDGRDLLDYGIEQQASILEHYFLSGGQDERYSGVLRRFLEDPRYPRRLIPTPRRRARR
ncbi:MAG TPA: hypothetical protein VNO33_22045 [Kofleriaceae bacterium]|nr:hypothetical protein [Kofleriaceae bacterium]